LIKLLNTITGRLIAQGLSMAVAVALFNGCTDMYNQPKFKPLDKSSFYGDHLSSRPLVDGTVARGSLRDDGLLYTGKVNGQFADLFPFPVTTEMMQRGQRKFKTFCTPCHGALGDGRGMIVQRGFPKPNSFHSDSLRTKPVGYYFDVMTNGFGRMYNYASSVAVSDRWAVAAYIRALQKSQRVAIEELSAAERKTIADSAP